MKPIFYILSVLIIVYWALGAFVWNLEPRVHGLLAVAILMAWTGNIYKDGIYE